MQLRPSHTCCGAFSLLTGVEFVCLTTLLTQISVIAICSSEVPIMIASAKVGPWVQVVVAAWCFVGLPVVVAGAAGALFRIENNLRVLFWYLLLSFFVGISVPIFLVMSGAMCSTTPSSDVQRMGSDFVCGFQNAATFFWSLIAACINMYLIYIVWSACEEIASTPFPELEKFSDSLKTYNATPARRGATPRPSPPPASFNPAPMPQSMPPTQGPYAGQHAGWQPPPSQPSTMQPSSMGPPFMSSGNPQSFIPGPGSGFSSGHR